MMKSHPWNHKGRRALLAKEICLWEVQGEKVSATCCDRCVLVENVFAKDASHGLSYDKMIYNLNKIHPRVMSKDEASKKFY